MMKPFNGSRHLVVTMHCVRMEVSCGQKPSFREVAGFMMLRNTPSTEQWPEVSKRKKSRKQTLTHLRRTAIMKTDTIIVVRDAAVLEDDPLKICRKFSMQIH